MACSVTHLSLKSTVPLDALRCYEEEVLQEPTVMRIGWGRDVTGTLGRAENQERCITVRMWHTLLVRCSTALQLHEHTGTNIRVEIKCLSESVVILKSQRAVGAHRGTMCHSITLA
jgi:hypothetical protein